MAPSWAAALASYELEHPSEGAASRARLTRLRRLGEDVGGDPWDVTPADIAQWLSGLAASAEALRKYRHAARSFYRWAVECGHVDINPVLQQAVSTYTADSQWADALSQFEKAQRGGGLADETIAIRVGHVRRFARETALEPWKVTAADYSAWVAGLAVASSTRAKIRDSLRTFYRWAHQRGRIDEDPTLEPSRRAKTPEIPAQWEAQLRPWRSWLRSAGHPEPTVRLRMIQLRRFARDHASLDPWSVTIDDLIDWLAGKRWASETRRAYRSALRSFYRWASDTGRIDEDPTERLPAIRMSKPVPRPAHDDDYERALRNAAESDRLALRLAAELGMRCGEVAQVHARDVAREADGWTLLVHGKGSKERVLPIDEGMAQRLRAHEGYVFSGQYDGHVSPTWLSARISRLLPAGVTMHALRHRFATKAYNVDRDVFTVQQLLGHASPATTQRYVRVDDAAKRRLVSAVAGAV
ncbi:tyrosine-type recombinase/integrase [uncultured Microbacterium sp.]|uniref:tyrosine-type recombinase/integrase n=1 Tax=uncultured Microbacterium sp. TaxID=191216 RepID=UPI0025E1CC19|nr:tyrosine-type recombinase/integrase [uncultured Microbacterium sp.]